MLRILDRSVAKAPSCLYPLTVWSISRADIDFAIRQLDHYHAPWMLKYDELGRVAVFVPGRAECD